MEIKIPLNIKEEELKRQTIQLVRKISFKKKSSQLSPHLSPLLHKQSKPINSLSDLKYNVARILCYKLRTFLGSNRNSNEKSSR